MPLSFSADNVGPLTRTARDCARVMALIAGHDPKDPTSSREPVADYERRSTGNLRGLRIGVPVTWFLDGVEDAGHGGDGTGARGARGARRPRWSASPCR